MRRSVMLEDRAERFHLRNELPSTCEKRIDILVDGSIAIVGLCVHRELKIAGCAGRHRWRPAESTPRPCMGVGRQPAKPSRGKAPPSRTEARRAEGVGRGSLLQTTPQKPSKQYSFVTLQVIIGDPGKRDGQKTNENRPWSP